MIALLVGLIWPAVLLGTAGTPITLRPPVIPLPNLRLSPIVAVVEVKGAEAFVVRRPDDSYLTVRLASVLVDRGDPVRRGMATRFLHDVLAGEHVWIIHANAAKSDLEDTYYVYRWPDGLLVNLEMVRLGYIDAAPEKNAPEVVAKAFVYWRDQARLLNKGIWAAGPQTAPASQPAVRAAASQGVVRPAAAVHRNVQAGSRTVGEKTRVYITPSGRKYHRADCPFLRSSKKAISLEEARKKYEPCRQCRPPS